MTGNDVALDTSVAVRLLNDAQLASQFLARYDKVHISAIAAGELLFGAHNSARHQTNVPRFQAFIDDCDFVPISREIAETYAAHSSAIENQGTAHP